MPATSAAQTVLVAVSGGRTSAYHTYPPDALRRYPRIGWAAGVGVRLHLLGPLSAQVEAALVNRGDGEDVTGVHARYLDVPVLARLETPRPLRGFVPAIVVGIAPARVLRCRAWEGAGLDPQEWGQDVAPVIYPAACRSYFTDVGDLGLVMGLAVERALHGLRIGVELRHTRGLTDVASEYSCCRVENRTTSLLGSVALPLGRLW